jgi:hypothetical protein
MVAQADIDLVALILLGEGYVSPEQAERVRLEQKQENFGAVALRLGFIVEQDWRYAEYILNDLAIDPSVRKPVGYYLLEAFLVRPQHLLHALEEQAQIGGRVGEILIRNGWITAADFEKGLARQAAEIGAPTETETC